MKKSKWLFNIITVVLCVCAMAIGVYAAKQASLTVNGQIGFKAHNCEVILNGTIDAYQSGGDTVLNKEQDIKTYTTTGGKITNIKIGGTGGVSTLTLPAMYFSDTGTNGNTVTLNLTTANQSVFDVKANVSVTGTMPTGVICSISEDNFVMGALNSTTDEKSFTITFTLSNPTTSADFGDTAFKIIMEFEKYVKKDVRKLLQLSTSSNDYTGLKVGSLYVEMGEYDIDNDGKNEPLKWYAFGYSKSGSEEISTGNMQPIASAYTSIDDVKNGAYYFISEYALMESVYNETMGGLKEEAEYNGSSLQLAVENINGLYEIDQSEIYSIISKRTIPGESVKIYSISGDGLLMTKDTENQALWAVSHSEMSNLLYKNCSTDGDHSNNKTALILSPTTVCNWWSRSVQAIYSMYYTTSAYFVDTGGYIDYENDVVDLDTAGVRPAFKLVID